MGENQYLQHIEHRFPELTDRMEEGEKLETICRSLSITLDNLREYYEIYLPYLSGPEEHQAILRIKGRKNPEQDDIYVRSKTYNILE